MSVERDAEVNNYRSLYDDDVHAAAYDRAVEWARTVGIVEQHVEHVADNSAGNLDELGTDTQHHRWTDDAAFYCPHFECCCGNH